MTTRTVPQAAALCSAVLVVLCGAATADAQTSRERYTVEAARAEAPPRIDGVPDEPAWQTAKPIDTFTQQEPNEGQPATERTAVRLLYDERTLYIAVHAYDSQPAGIVATEMRRDSDRLLDEDNFQVILDTFDDSRSGYMFVTTPLGAKLEQQISEQGEGGTKGSAALNPNINRNWDGVWDAAARVTPEGWTAEIAIPTATLRFRAGAAQTWGVNFMRSIRRKNEQVYWSPIPKAYNLMRVSLAGSLTGLRSLTQGMDLKLKPFVIAGARDSQLRAGFQTTSAVRDAGLDLKYGVSAGLNLDVTVNTDFAQVEVDQQQVNLTRFSLYFPEKRDFFLENAGTFNMGTNGSLAIAVTETELFFTRRIGLSDTGQPVPIVGGARLTGKAGRHNVGLLNIQTESAFGRPGENVTVARYNRDVLTRSRIGALFIDKEAVDGSPHFNRTIGADMTLALGPHLQVNSFVAKTSTPGAAGRDKAAFARAAYRSPAWNLWATYLDVQDNFNAEVGFVQRRGIRLAKAFVSRTPRPRRGPFRVMEPMVVGTYITDQANRMVGRTMHYMVGMTLKDGSYANATFQQVVDVLDQPFQPHRGVRIRPGSYRQNEMVFEFNSSPARRIYERFAVKPQGYYGGTRRELSGAVGVRATRQLSAELEYTRNNVSLPSADFQVNLGVLRVDYALSPRMTIRSLTQYSSSTHELTSGIRFNFIYRPGSDLYVVYNDLQQVGLTPGVFAASDRQLVVKFNYLLAR